MVHLLLLLTLILKLYHLLGGTGVTSTATGNGVTFAIGQSVGTGDDVVFNQVTGALVGNATTLETVRTIGGVTC